MHEQYDDLFIEKERGALDVPAEYHESRVSESAYPRGKRSFLRPPRYVMAGAIPSTGHEFDKSIIDSTPVPQELHSRAKFHQPGGSDKSHGSSKSYAD